MNTHNITNISLSLSLSAEANQFLTQFQQSPSAWSICVSILQSSDAGITGFFASQTLRNKLKYDLNQLPGKESLEQLRQELIKMLLQFEMLKEGGSSLQIITQVRKAREGSEGSRRLARALLSLGNSLTYSLRSKSYPSASPSSPSS